MATAPILAYRHTEANSLFCISYHFSLCIGPTATGQSEIYAKRARSDTSGKLKVSKTVGFIKTLSIYTTYIGMLFLRLDSKHIKGY